MSHTKIVIATGIAVAVLAPVLQLTLQTFNYVAGALAYLLVLTLFGVGLWIYLRLTRIEFGWRWGQLSDYVIAVIHPMIAILSLAIFAAYKGQIDLSSLFNPATLLRDIAIMATATFVGVLISEEGFFRGALWGAAKRAKWNTFSIVLWTTFCFVAWHIAVPFVDVNYQIPIPVMPVYFVNATLISLAFALMRLGSGSILTASVAHGVWNGLSYNLFGYGAKAGELGVAEFGVYGPERGILGLVVNSIALLVLIFWARSRLKQ